MRAPWKWSKTTWGWVGNASAYIVISILAGALLLETVIGAYALYAKIGW